MGLLRVEENKLMPPKGKGTKPAQPEDGQADAEQDGGHDRPVNDAVAAAAVSRAKAAADPRMVESLLAERRGYVTREMGDRVALVDEQIRFYGGQPPAEEA